MSDLVFFIVCVVSSVYVLLIVLLIIGMRKLSYTNLEPSNNTTSFSIIVPFRNEANNLPSLLRSLEKLNYPFANYEIILVNDFSDDDSVGIVEQFILQYPATPIQLLQNSAVSNSPKKQAIEFGIQTSKNEWIITTDADCMVPPNWLRAYESFIQHQPCDMIVAPVIFDSDYSFLQEFQQLDFLSLMGATQGGFGIGFPFLCNGANLCYNKEIFNQVQGFEGNMKLASGDDLFLMEKFLQRDKNCVQYLKNQDAIVITQPQKTVAGFINQRIRWASKTVALKSVVSQLVGIIVLSMNFILFISLFSAFFNMISVTALLIFWLLKIIIDFILLKKIAPFYEAKIAIIKYVLFSFIYPIYTVVVGILSFRKKYEWKGRTF